MSRSRKRTHTITAVDHRVLDAKVNEFIVGKEQVNVQRDNYYEGSTIKFSAHITYEEAPPVRHLVEG